MSLCYYPRALSLSLSVHTCIHVRGCIYARFIVHTRKPSSCIFSPLRDVALISVGAGNESNPRSFRATAALPNVRASGSLERRRSCTRETFSYLVSFNRIFCFHRRIYSSQSLRYLVTVRRQRRTVCRRHRSGFGNEAFPARLLPRTTRN